MNSAAKAVFALTISSNALASIKQAVESVSAETEK